MNDKDRPEETCEARVTEPGGWHAHTCGRRAKINEWGQWWCGTHAPSKVAERRQKSDEKWRAKQKSTPLARAAARITELEAEITQLRALLATQHKEEAP